MKEIDQIKQNAAQNAAKLTAAEVSSGKARQALQRASAVDLGDLVSRNLFSAKLNLVVGASHPTGTTDLTVSVTADYISVEGVGLKDVDVTSPATLDTGGVAQGSTWYYVWLMCGTRGEALRAVLSASATSPQMASNTSLKRRVGAVKAITGTGNATGLYRIVHCGDWWWWNENLTIAPFQVLNVTTSAVAFVDVSCAGAAPGVARSLKIGVYLSDPLTATSCLGLRGNHMPGVPFSLASGGVIASNVSNFQHYSHCEIPCDSSQIIEYRTNANTVDVGLSVVGYYDAV